MTPENRGLRATEVIKGLGRPVAFFPSLALAIGIKEAVLLGQLLYWTPRSKYEDGWVFKSAEDLETETGLTYREQRRARASLTKMGLTEERADRIKHRLYFRVNTEKVDAVLEEHLTKRHVLAADADPVDALLLHTPPGGGAPDETSGGRVGGAPDETSDGEVTKRREAPDETSVRLLTETTAETTAVELLPPAPAAPAAAPAEDPVSPEEIIGMYNAMVEIYNARRPRRRLGVWKTVSPARLARAHAYARMFRARTWWQQVFTQYETSPFLLGSTKPTPGHESFRPDLDWLLSKGKNGVENCVKVHDGRYDAEASTAPEPTRVLTWEQRSPDVDAAVRGIIGPRSAPARGRVDDVDEYAEHELRRQTAREQARRIGA